MTAISTALVVYTGKAIGQVARVGSLGICSLATGGGTNEAALAYLPSQQAEAQQLIAKAQFFTYLTALSYGLSPVMTTTTAIVLGSLSAFGSLVNYPYDVSTERYLNIAAAIIIPSLCLGAVHVAAKKCIAHFKQDKAPATREAQIEAFGEKVKKLSKTLEEEDSTASEATAKKIKTSFPLLLLSALAGAGGSLVSISAQRAYTDEEMYICVAKGTAAAVGLTFLGTQIINKLNFLEKKEEVTV